MTFLKQVLIGVLLLIFFACTVTSTNPNASSSSKALSATNSSTLSSTSSSSSADSIVVITGWSSSTHTSNGACAYDSIANTLTCSEQVYQTAKIGSQVWMAQNLNYNAAILSTCTTSSSSTLLACGALYTAEFATKVCPLFWHLPDTSEWNTLAKYVGGASVAGAKLKSHSMAWGPNTNADAYGFSALPAGYFTNMLFMDIGSYGYWWTSTWSDNSSAYNVGIGPDSALSKTLNSVGTAFSVRCIKDQDN